MSSLFVCFVHRAFSNFRHGSRFDGLGCRGHSDRVPCMGGLQSVAFSVSVVPSASVRSATVTARTWMRHIFILWMDFFENLGSSEFATKSIMHWSFFLFPAVCLIAFTDILSSDSRRNWRSVWIPRSLSNCGSLVVTSRSIGVDMPLMRCAHSNCIVMALPKGVCLRMCCINART